MQIHTEKDITPAAARALREREGLSQAAFWTPLGITAASGWRYEGGRSINKPVRTLVFMRYVAGLPIDASTQSGAALILRVGQLHQIDLAGGVEKMSADTIEALGLLQQAARKLPIKP